MEDGEQILGEFGFGAGILLVENQNFAAVLLDQPLDEFKAESGEAVPVGNHKRELISPMKSLQYGEQSLALPVESSGNVGDDFCARVEFPHVSDLTLEISFLLGRADPAIADHMGRCLSSQEGVDVVETLPPCITIERDFALVGIAPQGLRMESEPLCGLAAGQVNHDQMLAFCITIANE